MATSTLHRQQQKTGSWSTIFPTEQVTEQQSALFVKKLLAVAISNITYLRTIFPEHAFGDRCLEDLNLKILRDDSACPGACQVIQWVKGCFDALDKKYLRMIMVGIYVDADDPTTVVETYTFKFSYNHHEGISIFRNGNKIASAYTEAETRKATIKLLRTIVVLTQTLKPLPDDVMMTMKLLYYDEVTPSEYEPPGFQCTTTDDFLFKDEPMSIRVGDVATPFHTVKLRIRTECQQFTLEEKEETMDTADNPTPPLSQPRHLKSHNPTSARQLQSKEQETSIATGDASEPMQAAVEMPPSIPPRTDSQPLQQPPGEQQEEGGGEEMGGKGERREEDEQHVRCPCGCDEDDGLMVLCGLCRVWQHAVCFALLREEDVPELHICELCSSDGEGEGQPCTDAFLQFLSPVALQATCLWRRALLACSEMNRVLTPKFAKRLGVEITVAQGLVNRLEREGFIRSPAKGKRLGKVVNKDKIRLEGMRKYFEKTRKTTTTKPPPCGSPPRQHKGQQGQQGGVESITEQASSLNISGAGHPSKPASALPKLDECEVRRSPRIAKRVRSLTDQSVEFDISSSQDPDAYIDTNEGRRKRRKASIASRSILV